jgi:hypothetical protein
VNKINAVWATSFPPKATACALLSKHNMQNTCVNGKYSYVCDSRCSSIILYPEWNWDDGVPVFVYKLEKQSFYKYFANENEYVSLSPAKIMTRIEITPDCLKEQNVKLFVADNLAVFASLRRLITQCGFIGNSIIERTCQRIV